MWGNTHAEHLNKTSTQKNWTSKTSSWKSPMAPNAWRTHSTVGEKQNHFGLSCPCSDRAGEICFSSWSWAWTVHISTCSASGDPSLTLWFLQLLTAWPCWIHKSHLWLLPPPGFTALMQLQHSEQAVMAVLIWQPRKWKQRWEVISWTYCRQPEADPDSETLLLDFWFPAPPQRQIEQGISFPAPHFLSLALH